MLRMATIFWNNFYSVQYNDYAKLEKRKRIIFTLEQINELQKFAINLNHNSIFMQHFTLLITCLFLLTFIFIQNRKFNSLSLSCYLLMQKIET